jgi:hypothetical protein
VSAAKQATSGKKSFIIADSKLAESLSRPKLYLNLMLEKLILEKSRTFAALVAARPFSLTLRPLEDIKAPSTRRKKAFLATIQIAN